MKCGKKLFIERLLLKNISLVFSLGGAVLRVVILEKEPYDGY